MKKAKKTKQATSDDDVVKTKPAPVETIPKQAKSKSPRKVHEQPKVLEELRPPALDIRRYPFSKDVTPQKVKRRYSVNSDTGEFVPRVKEQQPAGKSYDGMPYGLSMPNAD